MAATRSDRWQSTRTRNPRSEPAGAPMTADALLAIDDLQIEIAGVPVVDGVTLAVGRGEVVAIVGESGSGKTLTALSILGLLPDVARRTGGDIRLDGVPTDAAGLRHIRGARVGM